MFDWNTMKVLVIGIFLFVAFTVEAGRVGPRDPRDLFGPIQFDSVNNLPYGLRNAISKALLAKNLTVPGSSPTDEQPPAISPIIGGNDAPASKYPWHAIVLYMFYSGGALLCGGSIYNEKTILTAGHCVDQGVEQADGFFLIITGASNLSTPGPLEQEVFVDDVRVHDGYRRSGAYVLRNDIALLITAEPLRFNTIAVQPVPRLSTSKDDRLAIKSDNCVAIGHGIFQEHPERVVSDILQEFSPVNFVPNKVCHNILWKDAFSVTPRMVCSIDPYAGTCNGDSGGSIGCYDKEGVYYQVGLNSWSFKPNGRCGEKPHVYTRVSKYIRWIKSYSYTV